jgi:hypothetical protein
VSRSPTSLRSRGSNFSEITTYNSSFLCVLCAAVAHGGNPQDRAALPLWFDKILLNRRGTENAEILRVVSAFLRYKILSKGNTHPSSPVARLQVLLILKYGN